jgi:hypothetical protein
MGCMGNTVTYSAIIAASAAAVAGASQLVHGRMLPAFETVSTVLSGIG